MSNHPINLALRFLLEIAALFSLAYWGWTQHQGVLRYVLAIGLPLIAAVVWGTIRVPGDASHSGTARVPVPGILRLVIELVFFGLGAWSLYASGLTTWSMILAALVIVHYLVSYDRVLWLIKEK
jgi:hypothetical protein